jgi:hypothetical protein
MYNDSDSESDSEARVKGREKGLEGLMSVGDTYDPELFSDEHTGYLIVDLFCYICSFFIICVIIFLYSWLIGWSTFYM